ncbi:valine--pyruvate transaminase [Psychrobacter pacificensis]|jgi:valine--pyruvate aminotransferase|uniref:valine--pyruvate transaminase n=1 Tax=Psychrobacter pacificensis TaxID=112002 RepID=UPI002E705E88|nr:valine--pyruvate transaminase [Pseudomonadota bacterium]|tara:strand:- start:7 stop:1344 length:1338 start_codon:yes stop_codon:yes gene_type:complete
MKFSKFGQKFTQPTGISQLMDDLGDALKSDQPVNMLGGGNPAKIDAVNELFLETYKALGVDNDADVPNSSAIISMANYSNPQGDAAFIDALVGFFNRHYDWNLTAENIALTNGSQNAFFYLFNLFGGAFTDEQNESVDKSILLPLTPEYIGYSDVHVEGQHFTAVLPHIDEVTHNGENGFFKYRVDFDALENLPALKEGRIGAICCSRPTNPTGNVLTDEEMAHLSKIAKRYDVPLIIDNAYGMPFPNIIYSDVTLNWDDNTILCFSLSKIGLPGVRTGIIVAAPEVIAAVSAMNAVVNLAPTRFGAAIATPLVENNAIKDLSDNDIKPFYQQQAKTAVTLLKKELGDYPLVIHKPEGAIFLWLWFKDLPISTSKLYETLKEKGTLIVPSEYFFPGVDISDYQHAHECIRMSIAADEQTLTDGIRVIGEVVRELYSRTTIKVLQR